MIQISVFQLIDPCSSDISAMNHNNIWSHRHPDPSVNQEIFAGNGFSILPEENKAVSASSSMAYHYNMPTSTIDLASSSDSDFMNFGTPNIGVSCDAYLNYSSARSCNLIPEIYPNNGSYYNHHDNRGLTSAENTGNYQRLYKRKLSGHPMALDVPSLNHYYNLRNSNGLSISLDQHMSNPNSGSHSWSDSSTSMLPGYPSNCPSTIGERSGSHRNVRSRHVHASGSRPPHFGPIASTSDHLAMPFMSHRRFQSQGLFYHEVNQPIGSNSANFMMEVTDGYWSNLRTTRNMGTAVPTVPVIPTQDSINYIQRPYPYSYSRYTTMDVLPRRRHRIGQNGERYGRTRNLHDSLGYRVNTAADEGNAHGRLGDENASMIERSLFYDPPATFDQHRNMRIYVDNMSYEDLIALGERIGTVSTGLTEDDISRCLTRIIYVSDRSQDSEEGSCVICLDEYKNGQSIAKLNCKHDFHGSCIKKWLLIKNACPICKSAAMGDRVKGKQVLLMSS